jgi:hypothetical protein
MPCRCLVQHHAGSPHELHRGAGSVQAAFPGSAVHPFVPEQAKAVLQDHLHTAGEVGREGALRIDLAAGASGKGQGRLVHQRGRLQLGQAEAAQAKAGGDDELRTELRGVVISRPQLVGGGLGHDLHRRGRQQDADALDRVRIGNLRVQRDGRVRGAMDEVADGIGLDCRLGQFPARAEAVMQGTDIGVLRMRLQVGVKQAELALIGTLGPDEAVLRQPRRGDAGHRPPAGMEALRPGAVL